MPSPFSDASRRRALRFILAIGLLNAAGQSVIIPLSVYIGERYGADSLTIGLLATAYALAQFLAVPAIGALSDRFGRRPLMLICLLGSAVGFALFGIGGALWVLFLARIVDGITGGNMGIMYAYIADLSEGEERTRYFGLLGAMAGIGIMLTPVTAGVLSGMRLETPLYVMAALTFASVIWGYIAMPESLLADKRASTVKHLNPFTGVSYVLGLPQIRWAVVANFLRLFTVLVMQTNIAYFLKDFLHFSPLMVGIIFFIFGFVGILVQGLLVSRATERFGAKAVGVVGLLIESIGFGLVVFVGMARSEVLSFIGAFLIALGNGLSVPALLSMLTYGIRPEEQGRVQGSNQSILALGRIAGPLWAGWAYGALGKTSPYLSSAVLLLAACGILALTTSSWQVAQPARAED